jgi:ribose/xylose/arabinose/galactoside ABC-type transport system permease subunit
MRAFLQRFGEREALLALGCIVSGLVFSILSPYFATPDNLLTVARNSTELLLIGLGMTLLLGIGGIDVSVGSVLGLAAIGIGRLLEAGAPPALAALAGPVAGLALGVVTAFVVIFGRIPAIVATLGLLGVYRAGIFLALGGSWLSGLPVGLTNLLAARIFGLPVSVLVIALAYAGVFVAVRLTPFGAHLLAIGNSEARARLAGIGVRRVQVAAFVIGGGLCGLAASFYVATYRNVEMTIGATLALDAVAAVVLGGTAVTGGRISLLGTAFGVILLRLLQNGLLLVGVPSLWQPVVTGLLLLLVLGAEALSGRLPLERLRQSVVGAAQRGAVR